VSGTANAGLNENSPAITGYSAAIKLKGVPACMSPSNVDGQFRNRCS
jgi:hypothetical protein